MAGRTAGWVVVKTPDNRYVAMAREVAKNLPKEFIRISSHRYCLTAGQVVKRLEAEKGKS